MSVSSAAPPRAPQAVQTGDDGSRSAGPPSGFGDFLFKQICRGAALSIIAIVVLILVVLFGKSLLSIRTTGLRFFYSVKWDPEPDHRQFGALAFVFGTVATSIL